MWNDRYASDNFVYGTQPNDFLKQYFSYIPAKGRVLCLAEGEGRNAVFLAEQGYEVVAVDMAEVGLQKAKQLATSRGVHIETHLANLADYDLDEQQWDGIVSIWAHVPQALREQLHAQVVTALKPKGIFLLEAYTPKQPQMPGIGGPSAKKPEVFMSLQQLQQELSGLEQLIGLEAERDISEGELHQGLSAVVQFIAKKA